MERKRVTLKDVAEAVGVHPSTVSRALDPRTQHLINPKVVQRIAEASQKLRYKPNAAAYSLRTNRSRTIGVIVPDIANPIFPPMIRGIEKTLLEKGYYAILGNTDGDMARERELVQAFISRGIDGLVLASVNREDDAVREAISSGTPVVTVNRRIDDPRVSSVVHMEDEGISRALTHLVSLGHRRIAFVAGPQAASTGAERLTAFRRHGESLGIAQEPGLTVIASAYAEAEGEHCIEELIARGTSFTAVMCSNDRLAVGVIAALGRRNIRCPEDISVTGYNDMPMVDRIQPPLTTVQIRQYEMGAEAGALLLSMIDGNADPRHLLLPVHLVIRGSTKAFRPERERSGS